MTPGFAKTRAELPWLPYGRVDRVIINAHNFGGGYDSDAAAYIAAVEDEDGASLATKYKDAINDFVVGAKADGFWAAIKAACFLAGPATLDGALVPLVGTAPTNVNFVSGDHNQVTGLVGNGSNKYLNSNRLSSADSQDSVHQSVWVSTANSSGVLGGYIGQGNGGTGSTHIFSQRALGSSIIMRSRTSTANLTVSGGDATGFLGHSRSASTGFDGRVAGSNTTTTAASQSPVAANVFVFCRTSGASPVNYTAGRLAWYSIGSALNLAQLDARLTTYMAAIA